jgi:zinc protease
VVFVGEGGAEAEAAPAAGIASIAALALAEGTRGKTADDLAFAFEAHGGELLSGAEWTHAEAGTTVTVPQLADTLKLLAEVVRESAFPARGVDRLIRERQAELLQQRTEPRGLADDVFAERCFATGARYAVPLAGSTQTVGSLTPDAVSAFHRAQHQPATSRLVVVGDIAPDEAFGLVEDAFGDWSGPAHHQRVTLPAREAIPARTVVVHRPAAAQSEIRIGHASVERTHPDFHAIALMNAVLGGLFNSRINMNLREEHAYTYGAFSSFDWRRHASVFEVSTAVQSDVTGPAVREILHELNRIRDDLVTPEELRLAQDYLVGVFPLRFETTATIANAIAIREMIPLSPDYYESYRDRMAAITREEVQRVAQAFLHPDRLQLVVVGDADIAVPALDEWSKATVERVNLADEA